MPLPGTTRQLECTVRSLIDRYFVFCFAEGVSKDGQTVSDVELGVQFTEIFIKKPDNVTLLLGLLEV